MDRTVPYSDAIFGLGVRASSGASRLIGVLPGEGVGPEVIGAALDVLAAVERLTGTSFEVTTGGLVGEPALEAYGSALTDEVIAFCRQVFERGGAILAGPAAGRFVYDLRRRFDLFCKLVPLQGRPELADAGALARRTLEGVDVLLVRENVGGLYQGDWRLDGPKGARRAEHRFTYREADVRRIAAVAARLAARRRGELSVVVKDGGAPAASALWRDVAAEVAADHGVDCRCVNIDLAAYEIVRSPQAFDVIVAPNLFGDVLADVGAVLLGSRGASFSGNFAADGASVFQTNHGSALDIAGTDRANPVGQIMSLAMLLRERFAAGAEAAAIEHAVAGVLAQGWRTADMAAPGSRVVGTRELGRRIAAALAPVDRAQPVLSQPPA